MKRKLAPRTFLPLLAALALCQKKHPDGYANGPATPETAKPPPLEALLADKPAQYHVRTAVVSKDLAAHKAIKGVQGADLAVDTSRGTSARCPEVTEPWRGT